ncbi:UNVERIFIED_CONTAM: hypothetical protein ABID98_003775 [Brevibacillus sp. OAP136]
MEKAPYLAHALKKNEAGQLLSASGTLSSAAASASFSMARQAGVVEHVLQTLQTPEACSIRADPVLPSHVMVEQLL